MFGVKTSYIALSLNQKKEIVCVHCMLLPVRRLVFFGLNLAGEFSMNPYEEQN